MRKFMAVLAACVGFATPVLAEQSIFVCDIESVGDGGGWVNSPLMMIIESDRASAQVLDPMILGVVEKPVPAKIRERRNGLWALSWRVTGVRTIQASASVSYEVDFNPQSKEVALRGNIRGAANRVRGRGMCRTLTAAERKSALRAFQNATK